MKFPYGYILVGEELVVQEEKVDVVRSIFEHYLAGASLGKIVSANRCNQLVSAFRLIEKQVSSLFGENSWRKI